MTADQVMEVVARLVVVVGYIVVGIGAVMGAGYLLRKKQ